MRACKIGRITAALAGMGADVSDTADSMVVSWATPSATPRAAVSWGPDAAANTTISIGASEHFVQLLNSTPKIHIECHNCVDEYFHTVTLTGLLSATRRVPCVRSTSLSCSRHGPQVLVPH